MSTEDNQDSPDKQAPRRAHSQDGKGKRWKWVVIAVAAVLVVGGGGVGAYMAFGKSQPPPPVASPTPSTKSMAPAPTPTPTPPPPPTWPLTGLTGDVVQRPALVVKVENSSDARPQAGLENADLVFEEMVEGGISRFAAIYQSNLPDQIVPVRSIRPMDGPLGGWTHGLIAFSGGQAPFISRAQADGLQILSMDAGAQGFSRVSGRVAPHNVAGNPAALLAQADADHQASPPPFCDFDTSGTGSTAQHGTPASTLAVTISTIAQPNWTWDAAGGHWLRSEGSKPAMAKSGVQLSATNVLILSVDVTMLAGTDAAGTHIPETIVVGSGSGLVASDGMTAPITWQKSSETSTWQFLDASGAPVQLTPGNTWIELVPNGTGSWSVS